MCLLVHQPATTNFSEAFLRDVYSTNSDGFGVMFSEAGRLVTRRFLPKTSDAFLSIYADHAAGRDCIWHVRMRTHGDVDLANCHPYAVGPRVALAHNGILSTGNSWDASKSDTWHFIKNVIEPAVAFDESRVLDPVWQSFVGQLIGSSNKFGIMTANGDAVIINRSSGVEYSGAWLSNTYAWSASKFGVGVRYSVGTRVWDSYDWDAAYSMDRSSTIPARASSVIVSKPSTGWVDVRSSVGNGESLSRIWRAARNCYVRGQLGQWVSDAPAKAAALLDAIEDDPSGESGAIAYKDPEVAIEWIADYFERDGRFDLDADERAVADY
jgi:hypothetical protein